MKRQGGRSRLPAHNGGILETDGECDHVCNECVCVCGCGRPCWWLLRLSARQAWGGFDVTEAVPVKHRFNTVMLWPGMQSLSPLILFQSLSQPLISDSAGPRPFLLLTNLLLALSLSLNVSLPSSPFLFSCSVSFISLLLSPSSSSLLIGIPWQSFWCNIGSTRRKRRRQKWSRL